MRACLHKWISIICQFLPVFLCQMPWQWVNYLTIKIFANIFKYIWRGFQHMQRAMSTVDVIIYLVLGLVLILGIMIIQGGTIGKFMKNILGIGEEGISQIQGDSCQDSANTRGCFESCDDAVNAQGKIVADDGKNGPILHNKGILKEVANVRGWKDCTEKGIKLKSDKVWKCCTLKALPVDA